jgi:hypothetical protein
LGEHVPGKEHGTNDAPERMGQWSGSQEGDIILDHPSDHWTGDAAVDVEHHPGHEEPEPDDVV